MASEVAGLAAVALSRSDLARRLDARPLLLDAALGTELEKTGVDSTPPLWSARALLSAPDLVKELHRRERAAGAEILTANTFRTHRRNLLSGGIRQPDAPLRLTRLAVQLAREVAGKDALVAGSLAPLEDCYRPDLVPDIESLRREHGEKARDLAASGVDVVFVETMNTVRELTGAVVAALETGFPVVASVVTNGRGFLLSGEALEEAAEALLRLEPKPSALGVNCVPARFVAGELIRLNRVCGELPLVAYASTGRPIEGEAGLTEEPISPEDYVALAGSWIELGARIVGGCCGTDPSFTRALAGRLECLP